MFKNIYRNKNILISGHTGFKGSWLALWLLQLGAKVTGYSLPPPTEPNHFNLLNLDINSVIGDVRDVDKLKHLFKEQKPEIVFHLAAQAIVRQSYFDPVETFASNVMGTVNILEAAKACNSVRAIVIVTSDKCYENKEWFWGYREVDALGGYDPYSASKGCAEIVTSCWRNSFFNLKDYNKTHQTLLATARAGNVIGGGDWAPDRLIPDIMRATSQSQKVIIRNPNATRPWQHVLEPLSGYLHVGQKLLDGQKEFAEAWNFGPAEEDDISVLDIVRLAKKTWPRAEYEIQQDENQPHEAGLLRLDCSKARTKLKWTPTWSGLETIKKTTLWYKTFYEFNKMPSLEHLNGYTEDATSKHIAWA
jgi:CDP-glucose 4,6-dehydratase